MINSYLKYVGFKIEKFKVSQVDPYTNSGNIKVAERYLTYLKELDQFQVTRTAVIENKNSLMIGQASVVTTIFTLFIPMLIDKGDCVDKWVLISISILFIVVLCHYLLAIIHALRNLMISRYPYYGRNTTTITKTTRANSELKFLNEEISDLIYCTTQNSNVNDLKGSNLIFSARCFQIANIGFVVFTVIITASAFFMKESTQSVKIQNLKELHLQKVPLKKTKQTHNTLNKNTLNKVLDSTQNSKPKIEK